MKRSTRFHVLTAGLAFSLLGNASREARAAGRGTVTLDDALVALLLTGGPAARVLSRHGADPTALRRAVAERDAADLASLGIDAAGLVPPRRSWVESWQDTRDMELEPALEDLLSAVPDERSILSGLLADPSGGPAEALRRSGVDIDAVLADDDWAPLPATRRPSDVPDLLSGRPSATSQVTRFVPVAYEQVRVAVTEPPLAARWLVPVSQMEVTDSADGTVSATDSRGTRNVRTELRRVIDEPRGPGRSVAWQAFWIEPTAPDPRSYYCCVDLRPDGAGTAVRLTRGACGYGRFAALGRLVARMFSGTSAGATTQSIGEVALAAHAQGTRD